MAVVPRFDTAVSNRESPETLFALLFLSSFVKKKVHKVLHFPLQSAHSARGRCTWRQIVLLSRVLCRRCWRIFSLKEVL